MFARRVAYSAYGKGKKNLSLLILIFIVQTLSKGGCQGLKVVASPQDSNVPTETAETDAEGK